jgi:hypothetical protein
MICYLFSRRAWAAQAIRRFFGVACGDDNAVGWLRSVVIGRASTWLTAVAGHASAKRSKTYV